MVFVLEQFTISLGRTKLYKKRNNYNTGSKPTQSRRRPSSKHVLGANAARSSAQQLVGRPPPWVASQYSVLLPVPAAFGGRARTHMHTETHACTRPCTQTHHDIYFHCHLITRDGSLRGLFCRRGGERRRLETDYCSYWCWAPVPVAMFLLGSGFS